LNVTPFYIHHLIDRRVVESSILSFFDVVVWKMSMRLKLALLSLNRSALYPLLPSAAFLMTSSACAAPPVLKTKSHYEAHSADSYEDAYFYESGAYTEHIRNLVKKQLGLDRPMKRTILDVGGGTGNFTKMIVEGTFCKAVVVDPFLAEDSPHDEQGNNQLHFVRASAEVFQEPSKEQDRWWRMGYNQVLLKEVIHHIDKADRVAVFRGIREGLEGLESLPSVLVITRPQREIDYPLWPEAKDVWAENQPSVEVLIREMKEAGFVTVESSIESYPCSIPLNRWQTMIKQRFWSTFSSFSDEELEAACKLVGETERARARMDKEECLHFEDRLLFLTATI
jgi:hypothetical protein